MNTQPLVSVVLPCRNEQPALAQCLTQIKQVLQQNNINGEIIVSDSSTDSSPDIAKQFGVVLVKHNQDGYGAAYLQGFKAAQGRYLFLADCDGTYDFSEIPNFIDYLNQGFDFVIGNRLNGKIAPKAMPFLHRYFGSPLLSLIFRLLFWYKVKDINCGMRAITKSGLEKINLKTTGMEFASEMLIKAVRQNLKIRQVTINYNQRLGKSKLKPLADGWRHLRFMLLYSPWFLFLLPGLIFFILGLALMLALYFNWLAIFSLKLYYHPMFFASVSIIIGYQLIIFSAFAKTYAISHLGETSPLLNKLHQYLTIEKASLLGLLFGLAGTVIFFVIFWHWYQSGFGALAEIKNLILAQTLIVIGVQTIFSSFMLSILGIKEK